MNKENESLLKKAFPTVYKQDFYFACGDGWFDLLSKVGIFIFNKNENIWVAEAKEKFGALRIYLDFVHDEEGNPIIDPDMQKECYEYLYSIEKQSKGICESCGGDANAKLVKTGYWINNLCDPCLEKKI